MFWHPRLVLFFALAPCVACAAPLNEGLSAPVRHPDGSHRHAFVAALREGSVSHSLNRVAVAPVPAPAPASTYVVQRGDTLYSLARERGVSVQELASLNGLARPQDLRAGSQLRLPQPDARAALDANSASPMSPAQARVAELAGHPSPSPPGAGASVSSPPGKLSTTMPLQWPISGSVTSQFGHRAGHAHDGIDIGAHPGAEVRAAADGDVVFADAHGGYGNVVILRHGSGLLTIYAHSERNLVRKGQRVRAGETIARVGTTGRSRGPHLHFEVRSGTRPQNPLLFLPPSVR